MKRAYAYSLCVVCLWCLYGCQSYEPPVRPVAYVFPTVRSLDSMDGTVERQVSLRSIRGWLERAGLWEDLASCGLRETDMCLLARGLKRSGYAELDVRQSALSMKWVSLSSLGPDRLEILVGYDRDGGVGMRAGMMLLGNIPAETARRCQVEGRRIIRVWRGAVGSTEREYIAMSSRADGVPDFWLKRLVLWERDSVHQ